MQKESFNISVSNNIYQFERPAHINQIHYFETINLPGCVKMNSHYAGFDAFINNDMSFIFASFSQDYKFLDINGRTHNYAGSAYPDETKLVSTIQFRTIGYAKGGTKTLYGYYEKYRCIFHKNLEPEVLNMPKNDYYYSSDAFLEPSCPGYKFKGWFLEPECINLFNGNLNQDINLYAKWDCLISSSIKERIVNQLGKNKELKNCKVFIHYEDDKT